MKKLIPALAMLLVAAALMGTSTYAWFSANEDVTANGMQVKAAADGGLAIASYTGNVGAAPVAPADDTFATSAGAEWTNIADDKTIKPTSTYNGVWYSAVAASIESHAADSTKGYSTAATRAAYSATAPDDFVAYATDLGGYAQMAMFQIKSMDADNTAKYKLKVSDITVTVPTNSTSANLNKALRVAIYCDNTWTFFSPMYTSNNQYKFVGVGTDGDPASTAYGNGVTLNGDTNVAVQLSENLTNEAMDVEVYIYFEGEDENCKTQNIRLGADTLGVEIKFSATK